MRRARQRRAWRPALVVAVVVTVVTGVVWAALASPLIRVTKVTVNGTSRLTVADVVAIAEVPMGSSLLTVPVTSITKRVAAIPAVARVRVERHWPHTVVIAVTERVPVAVLAGAGAGELLDRTGVAFAAGGSTPPGLAVIRVTQPVPGAGGAAAQAAVRVWTGLPRSLRAQLMQIDAPSPDGVDLHLTGGRTVVWGSAAQMQAKLLALTALLTQHATVYDVSTPTVAVTRG
jgi:cell division protein FtsQ